MSRATKSVLVVLVVLVLSVLVLAVFPDNACAFACRQGGRRWFTPAKGVVYLYNARGAFVGMQFTGGIFQPGTGRIYRGNCLTDPARYIRFGRGVGQAIAK